uniref:Beta-catenin-like protein 1 n=1 Tax=Cacopsylla melanoneura TaxID=428564 RepID=A0A8D8S450_9HEMI
MDIGELLSYKPKSPKRKALDDTEEEDKKDVEDPRKKRKMSSSKMKYQEMERLEQEKLRQEELEREKKKEEEEEKIKIMIEETEEKDILNEMMLKKMILLFEKRTLKNREMRIKFPDNAERFMESEIELHTTIQELHAIATVPDLYPLLVQLKAVNSMLELLLHENTDIAVAVVDLLQELTDVDILNESEEGTESLLTALLDQQVCALLVQNLERLDETVKEEADGVHNTLGIFENLCELKPDAISDIGKQGIVQWCLKRLKVKLPFDGNKLYTSEIISILCQKNKENRKLVGELDGIDILLQQLAYYKRHDPATPEEQEMMENLFDTLCSCLMLEENKERFLKGEGLQLMNLMLRERKLSRNGSLKVLDHAILGPSGKDNANKFVDILGLRTIFPLFMKTPKKNRRKILTIEEHEEHVVSIIANMLRNCSGPQRQRLLSKFTENDHEKVDRLLELHFKYLDKVRPGESGQTILELHFKYLDKVDEADNITRDEDEDENYLRRLDAGLFTLQLIDYVVLEICAAGVATIKQRVLQIINLRGGSLKTIRHVMREYAGNLGDHGDLDWKEMEQEHILNLVDKF